LENYKPYSQIIVDVSIVIINFNTYKLTTECIKSVQALTHNVSFEIILVDNASTEVDAKVFAEKFPTITLVRSLQNIGFAKGNNLGIEKAKGKFVLLLNSDTIFLNNVVNILRDFLQGHPSVAAVGGRLEYPNGEPQHCCQRFPSVRYKLFELLRLQKILSRKLSGRILLGFFFDYQSIAYPDWIWGTCFMFRRELLQLLPDQKLADDFFMYGEDVQWCLEYRKLGHRVAFEPAARIVHYMGKSGAIKSGMMKKNMQELMNRYYSKFHQRCIRFLDKLLTPSHQS
jgi:GT2 family glycosyltransferase